MAARTLDLVLGLWLLTSGLVWPRTPASTANAVAVGALERGADVGLRRADEAGHLEVDAADGLARRRHPWDVCLGVRERTSPQGAGDCE